MTRERISQEVMDDPLQPRALFTTIRHWRTSLMMVFIEVSVFTPAEPARIRAVMEAMLDE